MTKPPVTPPLEELIDETDALIVVNLLFDSFARLPLDSDDNGMFPTDARRGAVILADLILRRCWPCLDVRRLSPGLQALQASLLKMAAEARRDYGIAEVQ